MNYDDMGWMYKTVIGLIIVAGILGTMNLYKAGLLF